MGVIARLKANITKLSEMVLPEGTPNVPEVQPALNNDMVVSRTNLQGALVRMADDTTGWVPFTPSALGPASKKLSIVLTGNVKDAKEYSEAQLAALGGGPKAYIPNIFAERADAEAAANKRTVGGMPIFLNPVDADPFAEIEMIIGTGTTSAKGIDNTINILGESWRAWGGSPAKPPPIPIMAGIFSEGNARVQASTVDFHAGPTGGAQLMRTAALSALAITPTSYGDIADVMGGIVTFPAERVRPFVIGLASLATAPAATDAPELAGIRIQAATTMNDWLQTVDAIDAEVLADATTAIGQFTTMGITLGKAEQGKLIGEAISKVEAKRLAPAPLPPAPAPAPPPAPTATTGGATPGVDPVGAAVAAAHLRSSPHYARAQQLLASAPLDAAQMAHAVDLLAADLAKESIRTLPPPAAAPAASAVGETGAGDVPMLPLSPLRIPGSEGLSTREVLSEIAGAYGKQTIDLTEMLAKVAGRPPRDSFFAGDAEHEAAIAAIDFATISADAAAHAHPNTWVEAGRVLRAVVDAFTMGRAVAPKEADNGGRGRERESDAEGKATVKQASSSAAARRTAVGSAIISELTTPAVLNAERIAVHDPTVLGEVRRLRDAPYSAAAIPLVFSDGTATGTIAAKGARAQPLAPPLHFPSPAGGVVCYGGARPAPWVGGAPTHPPHTHPPSNIE